MESVFSWSFSLLTLNTSVCILIRYIHINKHAKLCSYSKLLHKIKNVIQLHEFLHTIAVTMKLFLKLFLYFMFTLYYIYLDTWFENEGLWRWFATICCTSFIISTLQCAYRLWIHTCPTRFLPVIFYETHKHFSVISVSSENIKK